MNDLISIIVPVYNIEQYIERCVKSIQRQTYENIEIILVDDGSTDESGSICDCFAENDSRIRVIHKENGGLSDARNAGINASLGKYIMFIDGDDEILPESAESLLEHLIKTHAVVARCRMEKIEPDKKYPTKNYNYDAPYIELSGLEAMKKLFLNEIDCSACLGLYKKECFHRLRFPLGKTNEDFAVLYQIFDKAEKVIYIEKILYRYIYRENSITSTAFNVRSFDKFYNCMDMIEYVEKNSPEALLEARHYLQLQSMYLIKEVLLRNVEKEFCTEYYEIRKTLKNEMGDLIGSRWFSRKEKLSIMLMVYLPCIYKLLHKYERKI